MLKRIILLSGFIFFNIHPTFAVDNFTVVGENFSQDFHIYNKGEKFKIGDETFKSPYTIKKKYLPAVRTAAKKWASVINAPSELQEDASYAVLALKDYNASATSPYVDIKESPYQVTAINAVINNRTPVDDDDDEDDDDVDIYALIYLGYGIDEDYPGWEEYSGLHSLYHGHKLADLHTVLLHEIMHALGITTNVSQQREEDPKGYYFTETDEDNPVVFDKDLRLYSGDMNEPFDAAKEIVPNSTMKVGKKTEFNIFEYAPYYVGETTLKVLSGKDDYEAARAAITANGGLVNYSVSYDYEEKYPRVWGMPIHNSDDDKEADLSHLELHNSFMSHQSFRNWLIPMEAELAVLKDIGYDIDLRKFFGKSYYLDNLTDNFTTGYSEWNGSAYTGNPSEVAQGVGLHIYGNNNRITQTSDISTVGEGSFGVRIDGVGNKYSLSGGSRIAANGKENYGVAVTWGKNHIIDIAKGATVTASGDEGIAIGFDFGDNLFGNTSDVRGSYVNYYSGYKRNRTPQDDYDEALVKQFNIAGKLTGSMAAVYIGETAHVAEINILEGAEINGNIISEWNSVEVGDNAKVQKRDASKWSGWSEVDGTDESQIHFTDINIAEKFNGAINGSIYGETKGNNTLKLYNEGNPTINGEQIAVYALASSGSINVKNAVVTIQNGDITGGGAINVAEGLTLNSGIEQIDNIVNLQKGSAFSTVNDSIETVEIAQLNSDDAEISFDLGDKYDLQNSSLKNTATLSQVVLQKQAAKTLADDATYELFGSADKVLDLGSSYANVYYNGKKYYLTQDTAQMNLLRAKMSDEEVYLPGAAADETTANYIVTENKQIEDIGTVRGKNFEVSGKDINVNGHKGMIVDSQYNKKGTVLKTGIFGASDNDVSVINEGKLKVVAQDKDIVLGKPDENALYLEDALVTLNAKKHNINVKGAIIGEADSENNLIATGKAVTFGKIDNVNVDLQNTAAQLKDAVRNTEWEINDSELNVGDDAFLADGDNTIISNGGIINLINDKATTINLNRLTLNKNTTAYIDIDLSNSAADSFSVSDVEYLTAKGAHLNIAGINLADKNTTRTDSEIKIPFISAEANNTNLLGKIKFKAASSLFTPIYKYNLGYEEDEQNGLLVLKRGTSSQYGDYNPAITAAPVAALAGGYLIQLNAYDEALNNPDMHMSAAGNQQADQERLAVLPDKTVWIKPSSSFEKVGLKDGPKVTDNMYNLYAGIDARSAKILAGWDWQYGIYGGHNYSRQKYSGNTIRQAGGTLGIVTRLNKHNFFNMTTLNGGVDRAEAETMYGKEHFYIFRYGIADKAGYNWRLYKEKLVIQPSLLMGYTFVRATNYHNAAAVSIRSHPLHALNIAPGILLAYDLPNGWQPYADAKMVWSVMNNTKFAAQHLDLPEMSVKPYLQYGGGVQKVINDTISAYGQVHLLDGGRHGVDLTAGIKWEF